MTAEDLWGRKTSLVGAVLTLSLLLGLAALLQTVTYAQTRISKADHGGRAHAFFIPEILSLRRPAFSGPVRRPLVGGQGENASQGPLLYGGGPVMRNPTNYVIIWNPPGSTFSATYQQLIEQYFTDIGNTPYMAIDSQYGDTSGVPVPNTNHFGGTWRDTVNAYPHAGTVADPLVGSDIQNEINRAITANPTWKAAGLSTMYFVYLGQNIIECFNGAGNTFGCFAGTDSGGNSPPAPMGSPNTVPGAGTYCAYHSFFGAKIYATMPYASLGACFGSASPFPNGVDQDIVLSPTSHEQFEAYSDPTLNAWFDAGGNENGDKCAYTYGQVEPDGTNVVLSGRRYQLQEEWSNALTYGCIKRAGAGPQLTIAGNADFGTVARGTTQVKEILIQNTAAGDLNLLSVRLANLAPAAFSIEPAAPTWGTLPSGADVLFRVKFSPSGSATSSGPLTTSLIIDTEQIGFETQSIAVSGTIGLPILKVTGTTDFGSTCAGSAEAKIVSVSNAGAGSLDVSGAVFSPACADFTLVGNPFPASLSPGASLDLAIRFTPTSGGPKSCNLILTSNDPTTPTKTLIVTGNTPDVSIDVPAIGRFRPEVIQTAGVCTTSLPFPVLNAGACPVKITSMTLGGPNASDFAFSGLPSLPLILPAGEAVGDGGLNAVFAPNAVDRARIGNVKVTYVSDPVTGATMDVNRAMCGEAVRTGARVLVRLGGVPVPEVEQIELRRAGLGRGEKLVIARDEAHDLTLQTVTPGGACAPFQFHREYGTVGNEVQLLPGAYTVEVHIHTVIGGKKKTIEKTVAFDVGTCDFNPTVMVDF